MIIYFEVSPSGKAVDSDSTILGFKSLYLSHKRNILRVFLFFVLKEIFLNMKRLKTFFKNEVVFTISLICAIISMIFVPPNIGYLDYINTSVLIMLFCLMLVVSGLNSIGVFNKLSKSLLDKVSNTKGISLILTRVR